MKHELPKLPYSYDALEPHIDAKTMEVHHSKHHQAYADKFNAALEKYPRLQNRSPEDLITKLKRIPMAVRTTIRNQGGGYINHNFFWKILTPKSSGKPKGELMTAINKKFGSFDEFKKQFSSSANTHFGSGWTWLSTDGHGALILHSLPNQDSPLTDGLFPVIAIDVWEHAYYLKYQNRRAEYTEAFWNIVNWDEAEKNFEISKKSTS